MINIEIYLPFTGHYTLQTLWKPAQIVHFINVPQNFAYLNIISQNQWSQLYTKFVAVVFQPISTLYFTVGGMPVEIWHPGLVWAMISPVEKNYTVVEGYSFHYKNRLIVFFEEFRWFQSTTVSEKETCRMSQLNTIKIF